MNSQLRRATRRAGRDAVELGGVRWDYRVVWSKRRLRLALHVDPHGEIELRLPWQVDLAAGRAFVAAHSAWLERHTRETQRAPRVLEEGTPLPLLDERLRLRLHHHRKSAVERREGELWVTSPCQRRETLVDLLQEWYRATARREVGRRLAEHAARLEVSPRRLAIRDQRTRWGSCSRRGTISINWRLMLAPTAVLDYVIVHELCHLRHMNHSSAFWHLVGRFDPQYAEHRALLRAVGPTLRL